MSISLGGLGLMSLRNPFTELFGMILGKSDIKSIFCVVVFSIVSLVLAYLTNPSENSFRTYLTEQSFRQHLSRLDDAVDEDPATRTHPRSSLQHAAAVTGSSFPFGYSSPFHFANRASVSLRTPKHVFHSFGILTIAAIVPTAKSRNNDDRDGYMISDSWFIGAFGRWWRGGIIEDWYQDVVASSKDEESWSSGILGMKSLDMLNDYNGGFPFSTKNISPPLYAKGSPPKLRNRDRVVQKPSLLSSRSTTPPPLPKSASLPLHTTRLSHPPHDRTSVLPAPPLLQQTHSQTCLGVESIHTGSPAMTRSPSALFDQSPVIAEVLRQISLSKTSTTDLRTQLADFQLAASQSHIVLQAELEAHRERKRQEDTSRLELKTRTKTLEESRRMAESSKRDAEKKLKVAQNARDGANQRMDHLGNEIALLRQRLVDDRIYIRQSQESVSDAAQELTKDLELKRHEIRVAEDVVTALNLRARELEESISKEKEQLREMRERAEVRKQEQIMHLLNQQDHSSNWDQLYDFVYDSSNPIEVSEDQGSSSDIGRNTYSILTREQLTPITTDIPARTPATSHSTLVTRAPQSPKVFSIFDDGSGHTQNATPKFSPFGDSGTSPGSSLIPSSLITSLDGVDSLSRSFQSESDAFMDKEWRTTNAYPYSVADHQYSGFPALSSSPVSLQGLNLQEHDPFEVRRLPGHESHHNVLGIDNPMDTHISWLHRTHSDPNPGSFDVEELAAPPLVIQKGGPRRWFSTKEKPRKGLNPDAKVFSLSRKSNPATTAARKPAIGPISAYDALNPNGLGSTDMTSATSASSSLLRAFAPSPAEREALQRALGGSSNTSFERLPSLSDVGSIPSSPSHTHAHPVVHIPQHAAREMGKVLPSWLQSLPKIRKSNFSPWDDDEPAVGGNGSPKEHRVHTKG
ncbi:hypothetical protein BD779DRAFT_978147 [Infundibulicybe gibba]|nr:hypothetical protein BD779DRAFT_978147 [Infundibulicybe gibba]